MSWSVRISLANLPEDTFGKIVGIVRPSNKRLLEAGLDRLVGREEEVTGKAKT